MKGLVLDGGGVFGIGQAHILSKVDVSKFDFFAGTSIGSTMAIWSAMGMDSSKYIDFFHNEMPKIFNYKWWKRYALVSPRYNDRQLNSFLMDAFPGKFKDVVKPVFITATDMKNQKLKVFYSGDKIDGEMPAWEVVRSAVAAETYFNPWKGYADGGIFANNPSMVAVCGINNYFGVDIRDMELCSIGTGISNSGKITAPGNNSTMISWGFWIFDTLLDGGANTMHEYFIRSLSLKKRSRIQFYRDIGWKMDNPKDMLLAEKKWRDDIVAGIEIVNRF